MLSSARPIPEIYEEVKGHSLVLTNDAPLATALNRLVDRPMIGQLAYTPKLFANEFALRILGERIVSKERAAVLIARELGMDLRDVLDAVSRIKEVREHSSDVSAFIPAEDLPVLEAYQRLPTLERAMEAIDIGRMIDGPIAVIAPERFNALDSELLPGEFITVDAFSGPGGLGSMFILDSESALVEALASLIAEEDQDEVAIVLNVESTYLSAIKSRLSREGIAINESTLLREDLAVRDLSDLLMLLETGEEGGRDRLLQRMGIQGDLPTLLDPAAHTFDELLDVLPMKRFPPELKDVMKMLDAGARRMTAEALREMRFALTHFDIPLETKKEGVLLVDCTNSMFVDRPVCIHIGLGTDWERSPRLMPFIDRRAQDRLEMDRFQGLLSQGDARYMLVNRVKDNQKVIPCFLFNRILGKEVKDFTDPFFKAAEVRGGPERMGQEAPTTEGEGEVGMFSQSSLNRFIECPKRFELSRLVRPVPSAPMVKGTLLHDFAELYAEAPEAIVSAGLERVADIMSSILDEHVDPTRMGLERSDLLIGMRNIMAFLDHLEIAPEARIESKGREKRNPIAQELDIELRSPSTELWFEDPSIHLKGQIDLVADGSNIIDYKTGKLNTRSSVFSSLDPSMGRRVDVQPLAYLLKLRKDVGDRELGFTYCHPLERKRKIVSGDSGYGSDTLRVRYVPMSFNEFVLTDECFAIQSATGARASFILDTGKERILEYLRAHPFTEDMLTYPVEDEREDLVQFQNFALSVRGGKNGENAKSFYKGLVELRLGRHRHAKDLLIFREDLDRFHTFVDEMLIAADRYMREGFPFLPRSRDACADCEVADICMGGSSCQ